MRLLRRFASLQNGSCTALPEDCPKADERTAELPKRFDPGMCVQIFKIFLKIGAFTFGGGFAMIPLIRREIVESTGWLTDDEFMDALAIAQSAPGAIAINSAVITGYRLQGFPGALSAGVGAAIPSFVIILVVASVFQRIAHLHVVRSAFIGLRPAVLALIVSAAMTLGKKAARDSLGLIIIVFGVGAMLFLHLHPVLAILLAGLVGIAFVRRCPPAEQPKDRQPKDRGERGASL
ncbi:MAG: chromate transporter [Betaproteobacteria bacterium]